MPRRRSSVHSIFSATLSSPFWYITMCLTRPSSSLTKVSDIYLQHIEGNRSHELPAPVYLKGFLRAFAKCLKLDPKRVSESYMERHYERGGGKG